VDEKTRVRRRIEIRREQVDEAFAALRPFQKTGCESDALGKAAIPVKLRLRADQ
jgi:hypothetical protein